MRIDGVLIGSEIAELRLPPRLEAEVLDLSHCADVPCLPEGLRCFELNLSGTAVDRLVEWKDTPSNAEPAYDLAGGGAALFELVGGRKT